MQLPFAITIEDAIDRWILATLEWRTFAGRALLQVRGALAAKNFEAFATFPDVSGNIVTDWTFEFIGWNTGLYYNTRSL